MIMKEFIKRLGLTLERVATRIFAAWCSLNLGVLLLQPTDGDKFFDLAFAQDIGLLPYIGLLVGIFLLYTLLDLFIKAVNTDAWLLLLSMLGIAFKTASDYNNFYYIFFLLVPIAAVMAYLILRRRVTLPLGYFRRRTRLLKSEKERKIASRVAAVLAVCAIGGMFAFVVGSIGVLRYKTFSSPNFDFGIFVNMFHNMKETGLPLVTCERDRLLSHFAVHISPIYYLLLPFYALFPTPETLQIGQAIVLASGVVPVYLICRKYDLRRPYAVLATLAYACLPALSCGTFYDIHENCFLTPLLLWMFYFFEKDKPLPMYIFAVLTLCVKEDAAIYVAFFALYILLGRKKRLHGTVLFAVSVIWFVAAVTMLTQFGDGAMSGRYQNYIYDDSGFIGMIKTCIKNPSYIFTQFAVNGTNGSTLAKKLLYILQMLVPLGFVPVMTKKISRYILLFPMVLMNLMPLYVYQYDIGFQYSFGSLAFLVYLFIMNAADMKPLKRRFAVSFCAVAASLLFIVACIPNYNYYTKAWNENQSYYNEIEELLDKVPSDASLTVSTFYLPHLADRSEIYEVAYHDIESEDAVLTDFVVIDTRNGGQSEINKYMALGVYELYLDQPNVARILIRSDLLP